MSILTKDILVTLSPSTYIPATPGSPARPAWYETITHPGAPAHVGYISTDGVGFGTGTFQIVWVPATPPTIEYIFHPAVAAVPPTPASGTPALYTQNQNPGWNAGAIRITNLPGDGTISFVSQTAIGVVIGLSDIDPAGDYRLINYGFYISHSTISIVEHGVVKMTISGAMGGTCAISRANGVVSYFINGALQYTSSTRNTGNMLIAGTMYLAGDVVPAITISSASIGVGTGNYSLPKLRSYAANYSYSSGASTLPKFTVSSRQAVSAALALPRLQSTSSNKPYATSSVSLPSIGTSVIVGGLMPDYAIADNTLQAVQTAAYGYTGTIGSVSSTLPSFKSMSANKLYADSRTKLPKLLVGGGVGWTSGLAALTSPVPTLVASGTAVINSGNADLTCPKWRLTAGGHDATGENSFDYTLPSPTLFAYAGCNASLTLPTPTLAITGTVTNWGTAALTAPSPTLWANGTISGSASANLTFGNFSSTYTLVGYSGAVVSITLTGSPTVAATGTTGGLGEFNLTLPLFDVLSASGTVNGLSHAELLMPSAKLGATAQAWLLSPSATLVAVGHAVVAVTYEAYAVNLNHKPRQGVEPVDEVTRYTNYPFDRIVRYKDSYFGMNSTGLYLLEGTTDAGTAIPWAAKTAESDMDVSNMKTVESAYFGGRMSPASAINLYVGEGAAQPYSFTTPRGALAQNYRQLFGRGLKSRYFALGLSGSGTLAIDEVTFSMAKLARKV